MSTDKNNILEIEIIIGGTSYGKMSFPEGIKLKGLVAESLAKTKNTGRPPEDWELKDISGTLLDQEKHLRDYPNIDKMFITLKAGIGG